MVAERKRPLWLFADDGDLKSKDLEEWPGTGDDLVGTGGNDR